MSTGGIRMICLHFYKLLLQWTFTILRVHQPRLFDLKSQFCGPYVCFYSECGQSISWLLTPGDSLSLLASRVKQSKKRISWEMSVYKSQEHDFLSCTTFHPRSYMLENFTLFIWALWQDFKNLSLYIEKLCVWEFVTLEAVRDVGWNKSNKVAFNYFLIYVYEYNCTLIVGNMTNVRCLSYCQGEETNDKGQFLPCKGEVELCVVILLVKDSVKWTGLTHASIPSSFSQLSK